MLGVLEMANGLLCHMKPKLGPDSAEALLRRRRGALEGAGAGAGARRIGAKASTGQAFKAGAKGPSSKVSDAWLPGCTHWLPD